MKLAYSSRILDFCQCSRWRKVNYFNASSFTKTAVNAYDCQRNILGLVVEYVVVNKCLRGVWERFYKVWLISARLQARKLANNGGSQYQQNLDWLGRLMSIFTNKISKFIYSNARSETVRTTLKGRRCATISTPITGLRRFVASYYCKCLFFFACRRSAAK